MNPVSRTRTNLRDGFHGWKVAAAGATVWAFQSMIWTQGFGNLAVVLQEVDGEFAWSTGFVALVFALTRAQAAIMGVPLGIALKRYNIRRLMRAGAVIQLLGFVALSQVHTKGWFVAAVALITVGVTLAGFLTITASTVSWFERKRAQALSFGTMGFALGGFAGPVMVVGFDLFGWRWTMAVAGFVLAVVIWRLAATMGVNRIEIGEPVDGIEPSDVVQEKRAQGARDEHYTTREAVRTHSFWMIALGHGSALLVVSSVMLHLPQYLVQDRGFSPQRAALVAGFVPALQLCGTLIGGYLGDRLNKRLIASVAMLMHGVGLLALTFASNWFLIVTFVVLHGLAWGARGPQMAALRADYFGSTSFGPIMGWSSLIITIFAITGPLLAGWLADATGDFRLGFTIVACVTIAGSIFFVLATPPRSAPVSATQPPTPATMDRL